jgi:16S rRNA (guanine(1405)-N(7))-methyltransferase
MPIDLANVIEAVAQSRRYRHVAPTLVARLASEELPKSKNVADAEKRTKRRLHQIFGAYATPLPYDKLLGELNEAAGEPAEFRAACGRLLKLHASTAERLADLERFYAPVFDITGQPNRVLDLACGLNPLTIPWMNLPPGTAYHAADLDAEMVRFLDGFLNLAGVAGKAEVNDLVAGPPNVEAHVAFLFKALPCLQHQTGDLLSILDAVRARWLVISYPTRSLGNRAKGMAANYRASFEDLVKPRPWAAREILFPTELVFVLDKSPAIRT